ncbi:MinD/ParA family protein [Paramaledivibacter caminithermalis]|jgi:flagellar biosynthesis protein FlhG|uniref:Flagellar biosynthesis protein FlhG n=1 Tax=Paramaledivibacter caminithermalis (strain DSM 15212 / CIP 107654 / DViRD3) TaxID=1121301 RepID=A0A1M6N6N7_PARC5|nr:MinD/ParA family protein [Paramaledivibacter caminithermalis]SHJ91370.1 flagellar biosynthesis protein FlhG [Paramaledivibacter caminithermalis DSM 15212]
MKDQATNLRELINSFRQNNNKIISMNKKPENSARVLAIASGKGGVGKTNFTINLGIALSNKGKKITVIDADLGLGNIDVVLGMIPKQTLANVIRGEASIIDIIMKGPKGINIISGGSGITDMIDLSKQEIDNLINNFYMLNEISDYILIDTGAGINNSVVSFIEAADEVIIIITPEPTSITDAYAIIKNIRHKNKSIKLVINRIESSNEGREVFNKISSATKRFLDFEVENLGFIYEDSSVKKSVKLQKPFILKFPNSVASKGIDMAAYNLINNQTQIKDISSFKRFINNLFNRI